MTDQRKRYCVVRELATGKEAHRFETTGKTTAMIDRIEAGVISQMDKAKFYVCDEDERGRPWRTK